MAALRPGPVVRAVERGLALALLVLVAGPLVAKTFVLPHVPESSGSLRRGGPDAVEHTALHVTYAGVLVGGTAAGSVQVNVYLFDDDGKPLVSAAGAPICDPCVNTLGGGGPRKLALSLQDKVFADGGFPGPSISGFMVIVLEGDVEATAMQVVVEKGQAKAKTLSVFGFEPQPVSAATP